MNNNVIINPISMGSEAFHKYIDVDDEPNVGELKSSGNFIGANTIEVELFEMQNKHIIPVFTKDNEPLISHADFIQSTSDVIQHYFRGETILAPAIRVSHPIKGRVPDARHKPALQLEEHEKTLYYERAMFVFDIPSIYKDVDGQDISLSVGGVKSYGMDKLNNRKGSDEHFKVFIGFSVKICSNLSVWSDGAMLDLRVRSQGELIDALMHMINNYQAKEHVLAIQKLSEYQLTESQFAQIMGRARLCQYLPNEQKKHIPTLLFTDTQMGVVAKDYYQDQSFCRNDAGDINLWKMYNLLTCANKSSYIDSFLDRSVNAFDFTHQIQRGLEGNVSNWYLN
jgi:hypothetical protein